jgi:hypothetical protein
VLLPNGFGVNDFGEQDALAIINLDGGTDRHLAAQSQTAARR